MNIKKIMTIITLGTIVSGTGVACGNKEIEDNKVVDNTIYLEQNLENTDERMVSIVDGEKTVELGESLRGVRYYNPVKEEYIIFDRINFEKIEGNEAQLEYGEVVSEVAITAVNKNGEKRVIDEVKMQTPYLYDDNEYLYYINDKEETVQLNIESKEKTLIGTSSEGIWLMDVTSKYCIYKTTDKIIAMDKESKERIEITDYKEIEGASKKPGKVGSECVFLNNDEFVYFDVVEGTIRTEKTDEKDKVEVLSTLDKAGEYFLYYSYDGETSSVKRKKFGGKAEKIAKVDMSLMRVFDNYFVYFDVENDKQHFKIVDFNKKNIEILSLGENIDFEDIAIIDEIIYYPTKDGVYKIENGKTEKKYEGNSTDSSLYNSNGKLLEVRAIRGMDNKKQSQEYTFEVYYEGKKIVDNILKVIESNGELLLKNNDGSISSFANGDLTEHKSVDMNNFNSMSIYATNEFGDTYSDLNDRFKMDSIEGYWKATDEKTEDMRYFKFYMNGYREVIVNSDVWESASFYEMEEILTADILNGMREKDKFNVEINHKTSGSIGEKEVVKINENEIKFDGQILKRISKEESDKAIKELMEKDKVYQAIASHAINKAEIRGESVKLDEVIEVEGVDYYIVSAIADSKWKGVVREDGEYFSYNEFTTSKEALNKSGGGINDLLYSFDLE